MQNGLWSRNAEKAAKDAGRNKLAVHLHTRTAGEEFVGSVRDWSIKDPITGNDKDINDWWGDLVRLIMDKQVPTGAIYEMRGLQREFDYAGTDLVAMGAEVRRILKRKRVDGDNKINESTLGLLSGVGGSSIGNLRSLVNELLIARRIAPAHYGGTE